ncbi:MAG TPA: glycosyltransferase family 4 protein, partial [Bacillota bacterium]|nr:glycosyltransferase family 4 protein [Bacillota bacterium]
PPRSGPHVLITLHNMVYTGSLSGNKLRFMRFLEVLTAPFVQQFIAVSRSLQDEILQYQSVEPERVITIYNGLDLQKFCNSCHRGVDLRDQLGLTGNSLLIGTVARLATQKGVEYFVRMASILAVKNPELTFAVVGDGPLRGELEELAASLPGKPRVHFIGAVSQVQSYLKAMDIFVLPSVSEGFGISVLEAMAMRRPVVATEAGGIPEIIRHEGNGLLVPPGDAMALARGVTWLMEHRSGAAELAEAGYHTVESRFTLEAMIKEIELVYEQSLQTAVGGEFHWQPR